MSPCGPLAPTEPRRPAGFGFSGFSPESTCRAAPVDGGCESAEGGGEEVEAAADLDDLGFFAGSGFCPAGAVVSFEPDSASASTPASEPEGASPSGTSNEEYTEVNMSDTTIQTDFSPLRSPWGSGFSSEPSACENVPPSSTRR